MMVMLLLDRSPEAERVVQHAALLFVLVGERRHKLVQAIAAAKATDEVVGLRRTATLGPALVLGQARHARMQ